MKVLSTVKHAIQSQIIKVPLAIMDGVERRTREAPGSIHGTEDSPMRFDILREGMRLEEEHPPVAGFPRTVPHIMGSMRNIVKSVADFRKNPERGRTTIDPEELKELRTFAKTVGADTVGFARVPREWVFRNTAVLYDRAVVLVMEMDKRRMAKAPNPDTAVMVHETYNALGQTSNKVANWLRERGFRTHAGHPLSGMALYPPMAAAAGLGARSLAGLLITPEFGPRVRLAAVFTEIENLPVYQGDDHDWIMDFCKRCGICVKQCPAGAIFDDPVPHKNGLFTCVDDGECFRYFATNHGCSVCIKVCPFNNRPYNELKAAFEKHGEQR